MKSSRRPTRLRVVAAAVVAAALCGAVGIDGAAGATGAPDSSPSDDTVEVDRDATLRYGNLWGNTSWDPHRTPAFTADSIYLRPVYDQLMRLSHDAEGNVVMEPQLATAWEVSDDGLTISFELRDDVEFHDGTPFNADVVKANIERAQDPESTISSQVASVESVEVVDDTHVVLHLSQPDPSILSYMAGHTLGMMVNPNAFDTDLASAPAGSGPFTLVSATQGSEVVYERWDDHWDPDAALVREYIIYTVPDANARYNGIRSDNPSYDAVYLTSPQDAEALTLTEEGFHYHLVPGPLSYAILTNTARPPLDDVRVRQAINMAVDRTLISEELLNGIYPPAYQPFVEGTLGHDPALDVDPYDPEAAAALIEEAGATGAELTALTTAGAGVSELVMQALQQQLGDIGLNLSLEPISPPTVATWSQGGADLVVNVIQGEPESSVTLNNSYLSESYSPGGVDPTVAEMAHEALVLPYGSEEREQAYMDISRYLTVDNPIHIPVVQFVSPILARPEVVNSRDLVTLVSGRIDPRGVGIAAS